jgi:hypothetical protein
MRKLALTLVLACTGLAGCVVIPGGGYYRRVAVVEPVVVAPVGVFIR